MTKETLVNKDTMETFTKDIAERTRKKELKVFEVLKNNVWRKITIPEIKNGDTLRIFESDGKTPYNFLQKGNNPNIVLAVGEPRYDSTLGDYVIDVATTPEAIAENYKELVCSGRIDDFLEKYPHYKEHREEILYHINKGERVFLGGTWSETSTWRDELIPQLKISFFNPIVKDWNEEAKKEEIKQRRRCDYLLYVITSDMTGVYSIAEVVDDSNKRPKKTVLCVIEDGFTESQLSSLNSVKEMVKNNGATVLNHLEEVVEHLNYFQN